MLQFFNSILRIITLFCVFSLFLYGIPSCTSLPTKRVDDRLSPYVDHFLSICKLYKTNCSNWREIKFVVAPIGKSFVEKIFTKKGSTIGRCNKFYKMITIDTNHYNTSSHAEIELTLIHELGHCLFNKQHVSGGENSIMGEYAISSWTYVRSYQTLLNDFFGCQNDCPEMKFDFNRYKGIK